MRYDRSNRGSDADTDPKLCSVARVLFVEDDTIVSEIVIEYLRRSGHDVLHVSRGDAAVTTVCDVTVALDLAILDVLLPGVSGLELCEQIRRERPGLPVVLLTALAEEEDRITGLTMGADDYVTKPFSPRELMLRVDGLLRRSAQQPSPTPIKVGPLLIDIPARRVTRVDADSGRTVDIALATREFDILAHFAQHPGVALSREQLLKDVWGWSYGDLSTVTVHVRRVRAKVETDPSHPTLIQTVWGVGYRLEAGG